MLENQLSTYFKLWIEDRDCNLMHKAVGMKMLQNGLSFVISKYTHSLEMKGCLVKTSPNTFQFHSTKPIQGL